MNVGPLGGIIGSAAGAPLSQTGGSEAERSTRDASAQLRQIASEQTAEKAAGIGATDEDQGSSERDADGRMFWQHPDRKSDPDASEADPTPPKTRQSKDPSGASGNALDLMG